jgi:hypothetical protein
MEEFSPSSLSQKSYKGRVIDDKVYLYPGMAHINPQGIVIQINGELILVPIIESNEYGVFVRIQHLQERVKPSDWCCTQCWNWNSSSRTTCWWCGADREE